jgi:hypothetical protein
VNKSDVKMWVIRGGISHVCAWRDDPFAMSVCGTVRNDSFWCLEQPSKRFCRKCLKALPDCKPAPTSAE